MRPPIQLLIVFVLLWTACDTAYFSAEKKIDGKYWTYENPFEFSFSAKDTLSTYDFILDVHHDKSYPYQNIYFKVRTIFPEGDTITDPFSVNLANKFGNWNGQCRGDDCSLEVAIQQNVRFRSVGDHHIAIWQYSRKDSLPGIERLEFNIVPNEN